MDVRSLNALAETWRSTADATGRFVPGFDPCSGGTASRVLVLMQSPGPRTIAAGSAAVCSEDSLGPTAAAFRRQDALDNRCPIYAGNLGYGPNPKLLERIRKLEAIAAGPPSVAWARARGWSGATP